MASALRRNRESYTGEGPAALRVNWVWLVLLVSTFAHIPIYVSSMAEMENASALRKILHIPLDLTSPGFFINFSVFDFAVPALVMIGFSRRQLVFAGNRIIVLVAVAPVIILLHSSAMLFFAGDLNVVWLLKESVKLVIVTVHFGLLVLLFQIPALRFPPTGITAVCLALALPAVILNSRFELTIGNNWFFIPRTVLAVVLVGFLFLLLADGKWGDSLKSRARIVAAALAVTLIAALTFSKMAAGVAGASSLWLLFGIRRQESVPAPLKMIVLAIAVLGTGMLLFFGVERVLGVDSWERSIGVRLDLWRVAAENIWASFPVGLGLGQFAETMRLGETLAGEGHRYTHNSFLGLTTELGLLGILLTVGLIAIARKAAQGFPVVVIPLFLIFIIPPLIIHDGHTFRMVVLVLALGFARSMYPATMESEETAEDPTRQTARRN